MKLNNVAVLGSPNPNGTMRLEFSLDAHGRLETMHTADGGRYSRVIRGQIGSGPLAVPVAIKLEKPPTIVSGKPVRPGLAKFASEFAAQLRIHTANDQGRQTRVVRMMQFWPVPETHSCDELPPAILCPHAPHALSPVCPQCKQPLRSDGRCSNANHPVRSADEVLKATVGNAAGCAECPLKLRSGDCPVVCPAVWLNEQPRRMLLQEQLDINLEEYLAQRWSTTSLPADEDTQRQQRFQRHLRSIKLRRHQLGILDDPIACEVDDLKFLTSLILDVFKGIAELHDKSMLHLDIKPANLCLTLEGEHAALKVIDLGNSETLITRWGVRLQSLQDDFDLAFPLEPYAAPEQSIDQVSKLHVRLRTSGDVCQFAVPLPATQFAPGDWFHRTDLEDGANHFRILHTQMHGDHCVVTAQRSQPGYVRTSAPQSIEIRQSWSSWSVAQDIVVFPGMSPATDIHALGMLLLQMVCRGKLELAKLNRMLPEITRGVGNLSKFQKRLPSRNLFRLICAEYALRCPVLAAALRMLPSDGELRELVEELLGLALRCVIRGVESFSLVADRNSDCNEVLAQLTKEVQSVRTRLLIFNRRHDSAIRLRACRLRYCRDLQRWLKTQSVKRKSANRVPYRTERLRNALDACSDDSAHNEREFMALLQMYRGDVESLSDDIGIFLDELNFNLVEAHDIHPVFQSMLQLLDSANDAEEISNSHTHVPSEKSLIDLTQQHCQKIVLRSIEGVERIKVNLQPLLNRKSVRFSKQQIAALGDSLHVLASSLRSFERTLVKTQEVQASEALKQQNVARVWDRLGAGRSGSWQRFGDMVRQRIVAREGELDQWHKSNRAALVSLQKICGLIHERILVVCNEKAARQEASWIGALWQFVARWSGTEITMLANLTVSELCEVYQELESSGQRLLKQQSMGKNKRNRRTETKF